MTNRILGAAAIAIAVTAPIGAQSAELRIGFINSLSGGAAIIGKHQLNGWMLGLESEGWGKNGDMLGGVPMKLFTGDDQRKVDVGLRAADKMLKSDKAHIVAGIIWSNILAAVQRRVIKARRIMISTNAGWSGMAGKSCSPYFISTSWNNDQTPEAMGQLINQDGLKNVFIMSANYQAGKDMANGFKRYYKGKVAGQILYKLGARDFQAEISKVRAAKPEALFIFAPGGMGVAFVKQWAASGAGKNIKLYTVFTVDHLTLPPIGEAAVGSYHTNYWQPDSDRPANVKFVKDYMAKFKSMPSHFASQAYDAPRLIAATLKKMGGKFSEGNLLAFAKAMRTTPYDSVRGSYKYNVNGFPIQNFYKREVIMGADGKPTIVTRSTVFTNHIDSHWEKCPKKNRYPAQVSAN